MLKELFIKKGDKNSRSSILFNSILVLVIIFLVGYLSLRVSHYNFNFGLVYKYRYKFLNGFVTTLEISLYSLIFSLFLGLVLLLFSKCKIVFLNIFTTFYIEIIRGTPLMVQTLVFYYVIFVGIGITNRFVAGILILSIFGAAYIAEIFRGAIEGVSNSQFDAARSVGLSNYNMYRYIILPQAFAKILPALAGQLIYLVKDSSILSIIAVNEVTMKANEINSYTYSSFEAYVPLAIFYLIITIPISILIRRLERKMVKNLV